MFNETANTPTAAIRSPEVEPSPLVASQSSDSSDSCVHHWLLSEPIAGVIVGRCKRCHGERDFPATPESIERFDDYRELKQAGPTRAMTERLAG